jgi:hypothetical protein
MNTVLFDAHTHFEWWEFTGRLAIYPALLAHQGLVVTLLAFNNAALKDTLEAEIYVSQSPGFEDNAAGVMYLSYAPYDLKRAANAWHKAFVDAMKYTSYQHVLDDPAICVRKTRSGPCIVHNLVHDCADTGTEGEVETITHS